MGPEIKVARDRALSFVRSCVLHDASSWSASLTRGGDPSPFARCFAIFCFNLLEGGLSLAAAQRKFIRDQLIQDLNRVRDERLGKTVHLQLDKHYQQLLTFSLSALAILDEVSDNPLREHVIPLLCETTTDLDHFLARTGSLQGVAQSGNLAMFQAILLAHAKLYLGMDTDHLLAHWKKKHLEQRNKFGFWGDTAKMTYLQFQNGFHQYEMLNWPKGLDQEMNQPAAAAASMADFDGHFAPWPGGGGCYDFDAVALITSAPNRALHRDLMCKTAWSILAAQNPDGGFGESKCVRPRTLRNVSHWLRHLCSGRPSAAERLRFFATLQRPVHDVVQTHWSRVHREWGQSDLWDTWFRMMALAKVDLHYEFGSGVSWGFIDFPGIGWAEKHHVQ